MLMFSKRKKLVELFEKWCKEHQAENCTFNMITWLHLQNLIDEKGVEKLLKEMESKK